MQAFIPATPLSSSAFAPDAAARPASSLRNLRRPARPAPTTTPTMTTTYLYNPKVDEFFAKDVRAQYIAKACPTGVPPLQCIEGSTASAPYDLRTLKRQSQLRFRQLPTAVKLHNMYETRKNALIACHGCAHEEDRVMANPMLANAMTLGQAEAARACNRYILSSGPAEDLMCRAVENIYSKAINGAGVFSPACTDGQARYEAYLNQVRGKSTEFRALQYSAAAKAGAAFAARKFAIAKNHICVYEDSLYSRYPRLAGTMSPEFGYYTPFVTLPSDYTAVGPAGIDTGRLAALTAISYLAVSSPRSFAQAGAGGPGV